MLIWSFRKILTKTMAVLCQTWYVLYMTVVSRGRVMSTPLSRYHFQIHKNIGLFYLYCFTEHFMSWILLCKCTVRTRGLNIGETRNVSGSRLTFDISVMEIWVRGFDGWKLWQVTVQFLCGAGLRQEVHAVLCRRQNHVNNLVKLYTKVTLTAMELHSNTYGENLAGAK